MVGIILVQLCVVHPKLDDSSTALCSQWFILQLGTQWFTSFSTMVSQSFCSTEHVGSV
jgi:hypothetical protein